MGQLVYGQDERVTSWVARIAAGEPPSPCPAIGYERDGELVAGVYFTDLTETNVFAHIASTAEMLPAGLLAACGAYVFEQCRLNRVTFMVRDTNEKCLRLVCGLGARLEASLQGAHGSGDVLLFALWRDQLPLYKRMVESGRTEVPHGQF